MNQISIITLHLIRLASFIFAIKYCRTDVLEQPGGSTPAFNVMAIHDQRHAAIQIIDLWPHIRMRIFYYLIDYNFR